VQVARAFVPELCVASVQVVLAPVLAGIALNRFLPRVVAKIAPLAPPVAVTMVALTCATVMAQAAGSVRQAGLVLLGAVAALHVGGFLFGYVFSRALRMPETTCRTNSIEVGMQNSTLGASLALMHFADPLTAAPCAISACMHSVIGSALAGAWRRVDPLEQDAARAETVPVS
jgi:bile acid:Na+ symporter, BASS family